MALLRTEWSGIRVFLGGDSDKQVRVVLRYYHRALDRIALAGPLGKTDPDTVGPDQDIVVDSDRAPDSSTGSADWDRPDCWNRDFLVALGSGTGYLDREHFRRIVAAGFGRDHKLVESSLGRMGIPGKGDILALSGNPDWDTRFVALRLIVRKDWQ